MNHPQEPRDASYLRAKALIQLAEECGFTTTLIAEHIINLLFTFALFGEIFGKSVEINS